MTNDLIAQPEPQKRFEGGALADSVDGLVADVNQNKNWETLAVDGLAIGLDGLGIALDPLGAVLSAGVGWLLEHISFLREPLEVLTGDPKQIQALSKTWSNIATELNGAAHDYSTAIGDVAGWGGEAAAAYRKTAQEYVGALNAVAQTASHTAQGVAVAGQVVAVERAFVFAAISQWVGKVVSKAILAVAVSVFTFGGSLAWFVTSVVADAITLFARLGKRLARLLDVIRRFVTKFSGTSTRAADTASALGRRSDQINRWADPKINGSNVADVLFTPAAYQQYQRMMDGSLVGQTSNVAGSLAARTAAEAAKSARDFGDGLDDGHYVK
ncbi:PPE domain-containing protein [Actinomadura rubrisoli]|uniref:PPE domain-containing protein n=1 Tax=Actinomadura rubrisoli TaxID=2530368 RepID=A0A4V2YVY6_9ACTN|nr:PPE domain-containing protein [Actinomadura rubrisoli]TDD83287.1 PPE domain-containing protein [Actinomadura rubrisoli]